MPQITRTVRIKLAQCDEAISSTVNTYVDAMNFISNYVHSTESYSYLSVYYKLYREVRSKFLLKAQTTASAIRQVVGAYQRHKTSKKLLFFKKKSMLLQKRIGWSFVRGNITINTTFGRRRFVYNILPHQKQYFEGSWEYGASILSIRPTGVYLNIYVSKTVEPDIKVDIFSGIDVGINNIYAMSTKNKACLMKGGLLKSKKSHYQKLLRVLKSKGTRGSKKLFRHISGKQKRLQIDVNHCASKNIVSLALQCNSGIALENLKGIQKGKHRKMSDNIFHSWAFYQLRLFITYKAHNLRIPVVTVSPKNTSKTCSRCNSLSTNRNRHHFTCNACGLVINADINAAKNIAYKAKLSIQDLDSQGILPICP